MKTAAEMIVDSAPRHFPQSQQRHLQRVLSRIIIFMARVKAGEEIQRHRPRKLGRGAETAFARIERTRELLTGVLQNALIEFSGGFFGGAARLAQRIGDSFAMANHLLSLPPPRAR